MDIIGKHLKKYIEGLRSRGRKRFALIDAENHVKEQSGGSSGYADLGGYKSFYAAVEGMEKDGIIRPVGASPYNGLTPALKMRWSIADDEKRTGWPDSFILRVSDLLDMSGYIRNPGWQTDREREYIEIIHDFLRQADGREWASCEERCLELFGDEKFLLKEDRQVLTRLNISSDSLKMKKYGWMFTYWTAGRDKARNVVILENHSTFFSFKRCAEEGIPVFSLMPDLLIFGDGKRIIKSLEFLDEIADSGICKIKYFGDIDPEGWLIYKSLRDKHPYLDISLLIPAYEFLLESGKSYSIGDAIQSTNVDILKYITDEFERNGKGSLNSTIEELWQERRRIPQELVMYERLKASAGVTGYGRS